MNGVRDRILNMNLLMFEQEWLVTVACENLIKKKPLVPGPKVN